MSDCGIDNPGYVFVSDRAIRSEEPDGSVTWFYREDWTYKAHKNGDTYSVEKETIVRNIHHSQTDVETAPVEESPFN